MERPRTVYMNPEQAEETCLIQLWFSWGCWVMNLTTSLPFPWNDISICSLLQRDPRGRYTSQSGRQRGAKLQ